ncbi:MAG: hypothetical protein DRJ67_07360 [Thermoprotei archaeon]|nr:MAG: hypothetical protein DRJ67_07360 [Thermoprotei archaeon]
MELKGRVGSVMATRSSSTLDSPDEELKKALKQLQETVKKFQEDVKKARKRLEEEFKKWGTQQGTR